MGWFGSDRMMFAAIAQMSAQIARLEAALSNNAKILERIEQKLDTSFKQENTQMAQIDDAIDQLTAQVAKNTDVTASAKVLISGFSQKLADAVAAATAAGATPAELKAVTDLAAAVKASDDDLAGAIAQNTPAASNTPAA
jgi:chromosome segregation ATPase